MPSVIENNLHFIWVGTPLPTANVHVFLQWLQINPRYTVYLWTETQFIDERCQTLVEEYNTVFNESLEGVRKEQRHEGVQLTLQGKGYGTAVVNVFAITSLEPVTDPVLVFEEMEGWRNYGAASDLLRVWVLFNYGGIYMDMDIISNGKSMPVNIVAPRDVLFGEGYEPGWEGLANHIIAGSKQNAWVKCLAESMARGYDEDWKQVAHGVRYIEDYERDRNLRIEEARLRRMYMAPEDHRIKEIKSLLGFLYVPTLVRTGPLKIQRWLTEREGTDVDKMHQFTFLRDDHVHEDLVLDEYIFSLYSFQQQSEYHPLITFTNSWIK